MIKNQLLLIEREALLDRGLITFLLKYINRLLVNLNYYFRLVVIKLFLN